MFRRALYYSGIILLNLTGLGLGLLLFRRWGRWRSHILVTTGIYLLAVLLKAYQLPAVWIALIASWIILTVIEGCLLAGKSFQPAAGGWVFLLGAAACLGVMTSVLQFESLVVDSYASGLYAYQQGDCQTALEKWMPFADLNRFSLNPLADATAAHIETCRLLDFARQSAENGYDEQALDALTHLKSSGPDALPGKMVENLAVHIRQDAALRLAVKGDYRQAIQKLLAVGGIELQGSQKAALRDQAAQLTIAWGDQVYTSGDYEQAAHIFEQVALQYPDTAQVALANRHLLNAYLALADSNYRRGELDGALSVYLYVQQQYRDEPDAQPPAGRLAELYARLAAEALTRRDYENAVKEYESLLALGVPGAAAQNVHVQLAKIYLEWAAGLPGQGQFEKAVAIYQKLVKEYADTPAALQAAQQIPYLRLAWVDDLYTNNQFDLALKQLQQMEQDYPAPPFSAHVAEKYPEVYLAWGQYLYAQKQYPDSIAKFELVKKYSRDARVLARAQQGIKQAQIASAG